MKRLKRFVALVGIAFFLTACASDGNVASKESGSTGGDAGSSNLSITGIATSPDYAPSNNWGNGWNLGNTLDAKTDGSKNNLGLSTETSWGMPKTTQAMINAIAEKGFKTIRVPVSWHNHITDQNYTIDQKWLARVKEIVDWSIEAGMNVIINIHHDNLTEDQMKNNYGFCVPENNDSLKEQSLAYIKAIWTQVSDYFKDYDEKLIFEVLNEPRAVGKSYEWYAPDGDSKVTAANKIIMEYEKAALDIIRTSGGNNATRYVMIPPYVASPSMMGCWSLPDGDNLIISIHAYTPYEFTMNNDNKFTSAHKDNIENWLFGTLKRLGKTVIIGETSASDKNNYEERLKWAKCFYAQGKAANMSIILWDNMVVYPNGNDKAERHGYFNRNKLTWWY